MFRLFSCGYDLRDELTTDIRARIDRDFSVLSGGCFWEGAGDGCGRDELA